MAPCTDPCRVRKSSGVNAELSVHERQALAWLPPFGHGRQWQRGRRGFPLLTGFLHLEKRGLAAHEVRRHSTLRWLTPKGVAVAQKLLMEASRV